MSENPLLPASAEGAVPKPNWPRAVLKAVPYVGEALDELVFGRLDEARWNRMEKTLHELADGMEKRGIPADAVKKEEFGQLLESLAPYVRRASNEEKRRMLRDLLLNAVRLPPGDREWQSVRMAGEIVRDLEAPALAILAALAQLETQRELTAVLRKGAGGTCGEVHAVSKPDTAITIPYEWLVIEREYAKLSASSARLVVAGAHGANSFEQLALTDLGHFVLRWAVA